MRFWKSWDEKERLTAIRIAGLGVVAITVFVSVSIISYLFHWKTDMSLLTDANALDKTVEVSNIAGKMGFRAGYLLVCELFGLGSFSLLLILAAVSLRLLLGKWHRSLVRTTLIACFGAFISSIALAFAGRLAGVQSLFGGGLGGRCGALVIEWGENMIGTIVTGCAVILLILAFLFFSSRKFNEWIASIGQKKVKPEAEAAEETEPETAEEAFEEATAAEATQDEETVKEPEEKEPVKEPQEAPEELTPTIINDESGTLTDKVTEELEPIDNRLDAPDGLPDYKFPSLTLLENYENGRKEVSNEEITTNTNKIKATLANYKIQVVDVKAVVGPTVTLYKVYPAPGVKIAEIKRLQDDIAISLNAKGVRVITLSDSVGIEVANNHRSIVPHKNLLNSEDFRNSKYELPVAIGYTITQKVKVFDLTDAPHLLVAGATKQGKSVGLNVIVNSLLYSKHPSELKFVFIDPKMVEFTAYNSLLKHFLAVLPDAADENEEKAKAIVKNPKDAEKVLRSLCKEMDDRYELISRAGINNIVLYNNKYKERKLRPDHGHHYMPYIVAVIDEYADLTSATSSPEAKNCSKSITTSIIRLAQKGRAAGIHVILATQRPSVNIINGDIKANFPMRIAFRTLSGIDSKTILDCTGAEKLIGKGDMLFYSGVETERIQCALISTDEIDKVTDFIEGQTKYGACYNTPYYLPPAEEAEQDSGTGGGSVDMRALDDRFKEAAELVVLSQRGSTSDLQRRLGMGYAKAGRVMDQLQAAGIVGPQEGSKPRQVLITSLDELNGIFNSLNI